MQVLIKTEEYHMHPTRDLNNFREGIHEKRFYSRQQDEEEFTEAERRL